MGFFSELLPELPNQDMESMDKDKPKNKSHQCVVDGVKVFGLSDELSLAREYYSNHDPNNNGIPCVIFITGNRHCGKSLLGKAIMVDNDIDYSVLDLCAFQNASNPIRLFNGLATLSEGVILEGYDLITDEKLIACVNEFISKRTEIRIKSEKKYISPIIIPINSLKKVSYNTLRMSYNIDINYSRDDYSLLYLGFVNEFGYSLKQSNTQIDGKAIELVGKRLNNNIDQFKIWISNLMRRGSESKEIIKIDINNVEDTIPKTFPGWSEI